MLAFRNFVLAAKKSVLVRNVHISRFLLRAIADKNRSKDIAIIDQFGSMTYHELNVASSVVASSILDMTTDVSTVAGFNDANRHYVVSLLATWKANKCFLPLCVSHPEHELSYFLRDSNAGLVLGSSVTNTKSTVNIASMFLPVVDVSAACTYPVSLTKEFHQHIGFTDVDVGASDALVLYTSGTTGKPKGVVHTHAGISAMVDDLVQTWEYAPSDKLLHFLPLHHLHGVLNKLLCVLQVGGCVEFMGSASAPDIWRRLAADKNVPQQRSLSLFMGVPTIYAKMLEYARSTVGDASVLAGVDVLRSMRLHTCGSAALPDPVLSAWQALCGHVLLERYGMTEIGMALSNSYRGRRQGGEVGVPLPSIQCRIVDEHNVPIESVDVAGELRVKGPTIFRCYLNRPIDTTAAFDELGWFKTGDVACVTATGSYKLLGRMSSDIIKCSGYKLSALEIERELLSHPQISEAAVLGVEDAVQGERIVAVIALRTARDDQNGGALHADISISTLNPSQSVGAFLKTRLAAYKIPRIVIVVGEIPRNHLGKVNKKSLKEDLLAKGELKKVK